MAPKREQLLYDQENQLLSKLERRLFETCKTSQLRIASKLMMHLIGSLINLNYISEVFMQEGFLENFIKSWKLSLVTYKNFKQFQPGVWNIVYKYIFSEK